MSSSLTIGRFVFLGIVFSLMVGTPVVGTTRTPAPESSPASAPCTEAGGVGADAAFAHEIDDPRTLAFLAYAENIAPKDRAAVDKRATAPAQKETTKAFAAALANQCDATEIDYRETRLAYMLAKRWSDDEAVNDEDAERNALAALYLGDRIAAPLRDAALAVFGTSVEQLDAMLVQAEIAPSPSPSSSSDASACAASSDAKTTVVISPVYPSIARATGVTGEVQVSVALDPHGFVRAVTVYKTAFHPADADGKDLVTESIDAAGSSQYAPQFVNCKPIAGSYLFRADYRRG